MAALAPGDDAGVVGAGGDRVTSPAGFVLRHVPNPRYRPPSVGAPTLGLPSAGRIRALDHLRATVAGRGSGPVTGFSEWAIAAGEELRAGQAVEVTLMGGAGPGTSGLRTFRVEGRNGGLTGMLGDSPPIVIGHLASLQNLRGAVLGSTDGRGIRWRGLCGVPTPVRGRPTPRLGIAGVTASELKFDVAVFSFAAMGFGRGTRAGEPPIMGDPDSLPGRGGATSLGWRVPLGPGTLAGTLGAQLHDLDGRRGLAAAHAHEWNLATRTVVVSLHDEHSSARTRRLGSDRFVPAPRREDRWNLQTRLFKSRAETHFAGAWREGGDSALASHTVQLGASGSLGASPWYGGLDAVWDWRAATAVEERRLALYAGAVSERGRTFVGRIERTTSGSGRDALAIASEASRPLWHGSQVGLDSRLGWDERRFQHATATVRLTCPLGWNVTRITGSLTMGALRDDGFRTRVREAALALAWSPRARDRGDLEVRRQSENADPITEFTASYDAQVERYEGPGSGWLGARDSGGVEVHVVRAGNRTAVPDVLVLLDGRDLRFTDADGRARFARVPPGVHVVTLEERSLPEHAEAVNGTRVFVTVEHGVITAPVVYEIARPERRTRF